MKTTNAVAAVETAIELNDSNIEQQIAVLPNDLLAMVGGGDGITLLG